MADSYEEEIKTALQKNDQPLAAEKAKMYLEKMNNILVNIAITGEGGAGKSTLVNALRGIRNKTEGAAPTGEVETTMEPTEYLHPEHPNIRIWDLPGVGTTNFTAAKYLKKVQFKKYDFFIIVSNDRFKENDAKLAKEIQKVKKKFYFVRSKIDNSIHSQKAENPNVQEEEVLNIIRNYCTEELEKLGFKSPQIFLVSGLTLHLYEFKDLWETLKEELPEHQRDALLLALPNISLDVIEQKKEALESKIKWYTLASAAVAAAPVPGLSEAVNLGMIVTFTVHCAVSLGLSPTSLRKLSDLSGVPYDHLKANITFPLSAVEITTKLMLEVLTSSANLITAIAVQEGVKFVPFVGIPAAMVLSGVITYKCLTYILNSLAEDAEVIFKKEKSLAHKYSVREFFPVLRLAFMPSLTHLFQTRDVRSKPSLISGNIN
uniref:IRG-type G domain-containing protein n=1 Tax=Neogobius melanostomus TaxID=47308 RepID=A0A8C6SJ18_9GOBI